MHILNWNWIWNSLPDFSGIFLAAAGVALVILPDWVKGLRGPIRWAIGVLILLLGALGWISSHQQHQESDKSQAELQAKLEAVTKTVDSYGPKLDQIIRNPRSPDQQAAAKKLKSDLSPHQTPGSKETPQNSQAELVKHARMLADQIEGIWSGYQTTIDGILRKDTENQKQYPKEYYDQHFKWISEGEQQKAQNDASKRYENEFAAEALDVRHQLRHIATDAVEAPEFASSDGDQEYHNVAHNVAPVILPRIAEDLRVLSNAVEAKIKNR